MPVSAHEKGCAVQVPLLSLPTLKSLTKARDPPGGATLNWNVNDPVPLSVAVASQVMVLPTFCGDASDGVRETIVTVANTGALSATIPNRHRKPILCSLMETLLVLVKSNGTSHGVGLSNGTSGKA